MNKFFKRIGAILVALTLCLGASTTAFAAESENVPVNESTVEDTSPIIPRLNIVESGLSSQFQTQGKLTVTLFSAIWYADFYVAISTNSGSDYAVKVTAPDGQTISGTAIGDSGLHFIDRLTYAPAGTYTFTITRKTGSLATVTAVGAICN